MRSTRPVVSTCAAIVLALAIAMIMPAASGAATQATCATKLCLRDRHGTPSCYRFTREQNEARCFIVRAARFYHQPKRLALSIAYRESKWHPSVTNRSSGAAGLYQFMPRTWRFTPYGKRGKSAYNPRWAALGAMWMWAHGYYSHWA